MARKLASVVPTPPQDKPSQEAPPIIPLEGPIEPRIAPPDVQILPVPIEEAMMPSLTSGNEVIAPLLGEEVEDGMGSDDSAEVEKELADLFLRMSAQLDEDERSGDDQMSQYEINSSHNSSNSYNGSDSVETE
jgi:hypothetical protein